MSDQSKWKDRGEVYADMGRTDNDKAEGNYWGKNRLRGKRELLEKLSDKFSIEQISEMLEIDISELKNIMKEIQNEKYL